MIIGLHNEWQNAKYDDHPDPSSASPDTPHPKFNRNLPRQIPKLPSQKRGLN